MFKIILICAFVFTLTHSEFLIPKHVKPLSQEMIDSINSLNTTWKAGRNFEGMPLKYVKRLLGVFNDSSHYKLLEKRHRSEEQVPESFDARANWPHCKSIGKIQDQGGCASGWAFSVVETMSDRICIASNGKLQVELSFQDLVTCCDSCGYRCDGGFPHYGWEFWVEKGIVTGGSYNSSSGCSPYTVPPCEHYVNGTRPKCFPQRTPPCERECIKGYNKTYKKDKHFGKEIYDITNDENQIKTEIYKNGPVAAAFTVYDDFFSYKSGVYHYIDGNYTGRHAIKIIGWGVENEVPYWLVANSWNTDWGDKGYFKILRGKNECEIEDWISAGTPDFDENLV